MMEGGNEFDLRVLEIPTHNVNMNALSSKPDGETNSAENAEQEKK